MSERSCQDTSKNGRAHAPSRTASFLPDGDVNHCDWQWLLYVCAVTRRRFPVGASPTRQTLQPEATGAVMEVTKWLKPITSNDVQKLPMASHAKDGVRSCPRAGCGKSACPVVCPAKAGMFSRRKACRGKSQKPRSLDSRVAGNQDSEAYRQRLPSGRRRVTGP